MGSFSLVHWVIVLLYIGLLAVFFSALVRILNRLGYSGWFSLLAIIPVVNVFALRSLSKAKWNVDRRD